MASERSPLIDYAIIGLLLVNVGITAYSTFRPGASTTTTTASAASAGSELDISDSEASALAADVVRLYNAKDNIGLYERFDSIAKAQLTQEQLTGQLNQLYPLMGTISDAAFSSAVLAASDTGRDYFHLNYKVRLTGGPFTTGEMRLTVTPKEDGFGLIGFYINGKSQPGS